MYKISKEFIERIKHIILVSDTPSRTAQQVVAELIKLEEIKNETDTKATQ